MTETPSEAMKRFIATTESVSLFTPHYNKLQEVLDDGAATIAPFLTNPQQHTQHIRIILEGIAYNHFTSLMAREAGLIHRYWAKFPWLRKLFAPADSSVEQFKREFLDRLTRLRSELVASLSPGELDFDILPARLKNDPNRSTSNLLIFQVNVALYPHPDFVPQALSVRLISHDPEVQFEDVSPSSRVETAGSYELGVSKASKITYSSEESGKTGVELGVPGAKAVAEACYRDAISSETAIGITSKETGQRFDPLVISSALGTTARWELLKSPQQPLRGGTRFIATAFVPPTLRSATLEAHVVTELEHYGRYELTKQKTVDLPQSAATHFA